MTEKITEMVDTLQQLERLLVRFEIDTAAQLHDVDYHATIKLLCENFEEQLRAHIHRSLSDYSQKTTATTSAGSHAKVRRVESGTS